MYEGVFNTRPTSQDDLNSRSSGRARLVADIFIMANGDISSLGQYLLENHIYEIDLNETLNILLSMICMQKQGQQTSHILVALTLIFQYSARWHSCTLFWMQRTPYHIISQCPGDNYKLLDAMIFSYGVNLLNLTDIYGCTAVMLAVLAQNIDCLTCLIAHNADLNIACYDRRSTITTPLIESIRLYRYNSSNSPVLITDTFDILLDGGADVNKPCYYGISPIKHAVGCKSVYCAEKLIEKGAQFNLNTNDDGKQLWCLGALNCSVIILKYLLDLGIDIDCIDSMGRNAVYYAVSTGDLKVTRYLLEAGVSIDTTIKKEANQPSYMSSERYLDRQQKFNPFLKAISMGMLDMVQLLTQYDCQTVQSIDFLKCAMRKNSIEILEYLLRKYEFELNTEYNIVHGLNVGGFWETILTEACKKHHLEMVLLFMRHGANPGKKGDHKTYQNAIAIAVQKRFVKMLAFFIRNGVSFDCKLCGEEWLRDRLPFECSVIGGNIYGVEMLLLSGYSCGVFSLKSSHEFQKDVTPDVQKLMEKWHVKENSVKTLKMLCRKSILNQLYPEAGKKIAKLPLPQSLIMYLSIPELTEILKQYDYECRSTFYYF